MKQLYKCADKYMIRIPLKEHTLDKLNIKNYNEFLINICKDTLFREQVLVSSKTLYDTMNVFLKGPDKLQGKKKRNFFNAITKYYIRSTTRTTPFGMFSSVGIGSFTSKNQLEFNKHTFFKKARVDLGWLFKTIKKIEMESADQLAFKLNHASYIKGDRSFLLYSTDGKSDEISIRSTSVFNIIYSYCKELISFKSLLQIIEQNYPNTPKQRIKEYLLELIDKEFLISNLRPPLTVEDQYQYFIKQAEDSKVNMFLLSKLKEIQKQIESYNYLPMGEGEQEYIGLYDSMNEIAESRSPLQIDVGLGDRNINLKYRLGQDISSLASMLTMIAMPFGKKSTHLELYKTKFIEKYGFEREVLLIEMLDSSSGIGAPATYTNPRNDYYEANQIDKSYTPEMKNYFLMKYFEAVKNNTPIELCEGELKEYYDIEIDNQEVPVSLEMNFIVKERDGDIKLYLGSNIGSASAGKTFGRFSHVSNEFREIIRDLNLKEKEIKNKNSNLCELSYIPNNIRSGNVTRNISYRDKEMSLFSNGSKSEQEMVKIKDILIGIDNNTFYARHKKTGDILEFGTNNMLNPFIASNPIRFLLEIARDGKRDWDLFPWMDIYEGFKYIPEIKYKNIILSSEQWHINMMDLKLTSNSVFEDFKIKFLEFHTNYDLPQQFYIVNADNRLLICIDDDKSMAILFEELKKIRGNQIHLVGVETDEDAVRDSDKRPYVAEIVVPLFKREQEEKKEIKFYPQIIESGSHRVKLPFDEWLFIKLYGKQSREEELIAFEIAEFCGNLNNDYPTQYFFMRYQDPKPHIRLRIKGDNNTLFGITPHILAWLENLRQRDVISDFVISPYNREIERYGGPALIDAAEQIFYADSKVVELIIKATRLKQNTMDKEIIGTISIIKYLDQFGLDFESQLRLLQQNGNDSKYRSEFNKNREKYLSICNNKNDWEKLRETIEGNALISNLESRSEAVKSYAQLMSKQLNSLFTTPDSIVSSVVHLHCNRLFGTDREFENKIMALTAYTLYAQRYQKLKGK